MANILKLANEIINERSEEKERQYGPMGEGLERAAQIASGVTGKDFTADDIFAVLIALKFSRHSYNYKEDNFCKPLENYYPTLIEDLKNTKNLKDKSKDYLSNKRRYYAFTSYYYMYILYKETPFDIEKY